MKKPAGFGRASLFFVVENESVAESAQAYPAVTVWTPTLWSAPPCRAFPGAESAQDWCNLSAR